MSPAWYVRIWEYFSSVVGFWQFWVAVAFMMERAFERFLPEVAGRANPYFTPERRRKFFVWVGVIAFVYANFRAFDGERQEKESALLAGQANESGLASQQKAIQDLQARLTQTQKTLDDLAHPPMPPNITNHEDQSRMIAILKAAGPHVFRINQVTRDTATSTLAQNVYDTFVLSGWQPDAPNPVPVGYLGVSGVMVSGRTALNNPNIIATLKSAFAKVGIDAPIDQASNSFVKEDSTVEIFVGR